MTDLNLLESKVLSTKMIHVIFDLFFRTNREKTDFAFRVKYFECTGAAYMR